MRTKIFFTTLLLFVGLISNAQKDKKSTNTNTQENKNNSGSNTSSSSTLTDATDNYTGNTKLVNVTTDVYFLQGDDENMGVILTKSGVILIDTQTEEEMTRSLKIVKRLNKKLPINYLISSSNTIKNKKVTSDLRKDGTLFIAQNSTTSPSSKNKPGTTGGYTASFKPDLAFNDQLTLNIDTKKIDIITLNKFGNSAIYLTKANVVFTGPVYSNNRYPEIDSENGKRIEDYTNALSKIKNIIDDNTKVVCGQGGIARKINLVNYSKMLGTIYKQVYSLREVGKTLEEVLAMKSITKNYDSKGYGEGPITTEIFITSIYNEVAKELGPLDTRTPEEKAMDRLKEIQKENGNKN